MPIGKKVRLVIGRNIRRIREAREMKGSDLSARLNELGLKLGTSGVSEVETATRKLGADELLVFAIALNTSVIDLLTPADGSPLAIAEGVEPMHPAWLEDWLRGETPWPVTADDAEFFGTASEERKLRHRTGTRPELHELAALRSAVVGAIDGPSEFNQVEDPEVMAQYLRDQLERVDSYVELLADHIQRNGYVAR